MKLIEARVAGQPRIVSTRRGDRSVMDCRTADGQSLTVWRPAGDVELMARANGERVTLAQDSKGKISLVETAQSRADREWQRPTDLDSELGLMDRTAPPKLPTILNVWANSTITVTEWLVASWLRQKWIRPKLRMYPPHCLFKLSGILVCRSKCQGLRSDCAGRWLRSANDSRS
jgi:hypothetical protein